MLTIENNIKFKNLIEKIDTSEQRWLHDFYDTGNDALEKFIREYSHDAEFIKLKEYIKFRRSEENDINGYFYIFLKKLDHLKF